MFNQKRGNRIYFGYYVGDGSDICLLKQLYRLIGFKIFNLEDVKLLNKEWVYNIELVFVSIFEIYLELRKIEHYFGTHLKFK